MKNSRIVITGVGLTSPIGNSLHEFRQNLLSGTSGISIFPSKIIGDVFAGVCKFDELKYQNKRSLRRGTRAGSIGIYSANEAVLDANLDISGFDKSRIGVYVGITEHGSVETIDEFLAFKECGYDEREWSHYFNPRAISNNPPGEIALNLGITGPHYAIGAACASGNAGLIQGVQMLLLDEVDVALAGGVSESIRGFGIFLGFKNEGALGSNIAPEKVSRPFDTGRNGIVISEGGCMFVLERLDDARKRDAKIYAEVVGYAVNTDATGYVSPNASRQAECMALALKRAGLKPSEIDIINSHATSTPSGDEIEGIAIDMIFGGHDSVFVTNTKSFIGHTMGAAGALELAGELPAFEDGIVHHTLNLDNLDPRCKIKNIVKDAPIKVENIKHILNNAFGMLGINSTVIVKKV